MTQATLKVVGGFHGLSRARSDARRYPAIDPLDSWSKYNSVIEQERVEKARAILRKCSEIGQMMKVVGEEGTSLEDFAVYLKAEFLDQGIVELHFNGAVHIAYVMRGYAAAFDELSELPHGVYL